MTKFLNEFPTQYQKLEKNSDPIPRKRPDKRREGRKDGQTDGRTGR